MYVQMSGRALLAKHTQHCTQSAAAYFISVTQTVVHDDAGDGWLPHAWLWYWGVEAPQQLESTHGHLIPQNQYGLWQQRRR